VSSFATKMEI